MVKDKVLSKEIDRLRKVLEHTARLHKYNFKHPNVIRVSQKLDSLILKSMKNNA